MSEHPNDRNVLTPETLTVYFDAGYPAEQRLAEEPLCALGIDLSRGELTLCTPATSSGIDVSVYRMIRTDIVEEPGDETVWFRVTVEVRGIEYEAYSLLQAVTDQFQQGDDLKHTPHVALDTLRELLARAPRLNEDQKTGLFGELVPPDRLIDGVGKVKALAAQLGPWAEEHDFVLGEADIEVRTTRGERRIHVIHGLDQPTPTPGRLLYLMPVQVTRADAAGDGEALPELIERTRWRLRSGCTGFDDRLTDCGWKDAQADRLYTTCLLIHSGPRLYAADEVFPVVASVGLSRIVTRPGLARSTDYRIDVADLKPEGTAPAEFAVAPTHED